MRLLVLLLDFSSLFSEGNHRKIRLHGVMEPASPENLNMMIVNGPASHHTVDNDITIKIATDTI